MKYRIKAKHLKGSTLVQFDSPSVSVLQLKTKIADIFHLENTESTDSFQLSFNGTDSINAGEADSLASLGFVSGDVIYILGISHIRQECLGEQLSANQALDSSKTVSEPVSDQVNHSTSAADGSIPSACLSETPNLTVPSSFSTLLSANPDKFHSIFEEFCGLLHLLIIESGFTPSISGKTGKPSYYNIPDSWNVQHETLKLNYHSPYPPFSLCTFVITAIGKIVMVYGLASSEKSMTLKLKPSDFISNGSYTNLKKLSLLFKNEISYPLLVTIQREINGPCPYNFSNLPPEISYRILILLDVQSLCRLSKVSRLFQELTNQNCIWKRLLYRDFGSHIDGASSNNNWREIYKAEYAMKQKQKRATASLLRYPRPTFPPAPLGPFMPSPILPQFPGIFGGDDDRLPDLRGIPSPSRRLPFSRGINRNHPFYPF